jgi:periplasmic divalent cation tolerance protein
MVDTPEPKRWLAYSTVNSRDNARKLAAECVRRKVVACVSVIGPVESIYEWQGAVVQDDEWMIMMKLVDSQKTGLLATVNELHDYDVPELIFIPIEAGAMPYLAWMDNCAKQKGVF